MKYSEFEREVEKLGCEVYDRGCDLYIKRNTYTILTVNKNKEFEFDNEWNKWSGIGEIKSPLFDLAYQLAKTPLAEREEEKKYNVILPNILRDRKPILLCKSFDDHESCGIDWSPKDWLDDNMDRHIFTEQEIKDIDERYLAFKVEVTPE